MKRAKHFTHHLKSRMSRSTSKRGLQWLEHALGELQLYGKTTSWCGKLWVWRPVVPCTRASSKASKASSLGQDVMGALHTQPSQPNYDGSQVYKDICMQLFGFKYIRNGPAGIGFQVYKDMFGFKYQEWVGSYGFKY